MVNTMYPFQIASYLNNSQTLAITESLQVAPGVNNQDNGRKPVPPLETPGYSVFRVALINDDKKILTANIPEDDIIGIYEDSKIARRLKSKAGTQQETTNISDIKFGMGRHKGKTPLEVLKEPNGKDELLKMKSFLESNLKRYPGNQIQVDAINAALSGEIKEDHSHTSSSEPTSYEIYSSGPKPLKSRSIKSGFYFCYIMTITKNLLMRYPYEISITNCYVPMKKAAGGQEIPSLSQAIESVTSKIFIPEKDYFEMITKMNEFRLNFRALSLPNQLKVAHSINTQNISSAQQNN